MEGAVVCHTQCISPTPRYISTLLSNMCSEFVGAGAPLMAKSSVGLNSWGGQISTKIQKWLYDSPPYPKVVIPSPLHWPPGGTVELGRATVIPNGKAGISYLVGQNRDR